MTCFLGSIEVVVVPVSGYTLKVNSLKDDSHVTSDSLVSFQWFYGQNVHFFDGLGSADLIARSTPEARFVGSWNLDTPSYLGFQESR